MDNTKYKILLIEDNELDQKAFERFVKNSDIPYDYTIAGSVSDATEKLNSNQFDAVISDHSLGDGTAFDILEIVKNVPVIVVTGAGDEETAVKAWKAGAYDYLIKDIDRNYLRAIPITVENAIRHKIIEKKLQLLSGAIMSTDDSVYITDMKGIIIFVNKAFYETYGYKEEEIVGKSGSTLWIGKHQTESTRSVFQTQGIGSSSEVGFYHKRKDDSVFPVSLSRSIIRDSKGGEVAIVSVARDISERILIEDEFRKASLNLRKKYEHKNEMAIIITEALQKLLSKGDVSCANSMISDYINILKIEAGKLTLKRCRFDFVKLISRMMENLFHLAKEKKIELEYSAAENTIFIDADPDNVSQVLYILLFRAIEFSPANTKVFIRINDIGGELVVEIHDGTPALESSELYRITNHSDWIKEQIEAGREEIALGLRIAKELIELNGGRIWTESSDTKNNIFCFTIPKSNVTNITSNEVYSINFG